MPRITVINSKYTPINSHHHHCIKSSMFPCVCVCEREREREREKHQHYSSHLKQNSLVGHLTQDYQEERTGSTKVSSTTYSPPQKQSAINIKG